MIKRFITLTDKQLREINKYRGRLSVRQYVEVAISAFNASNKNLRRDQ